MRSTIIPAQMTTVEDKIAGSLTLPQLLILTCPVIWMAIVYILFPPSMTLASYKLVFICACVGICITLALRVKNKIIAEWCCILLRYHLRPHYWIYNKNDRTCRTLDIPHIPDGHVSAHRATHPVFKPHVEDIAIADLVKLHALIDSGKIAIRYHVDEKQPYAYHT